MFYDPLVETAGAIAEQYEISISDVLGLLMLSGKDEVLVRQVLAESSDSEGATQAQQQGQQFDLVEHARTRLQQVLAEREARGL